MHSNSILVCNEVECCEVMLTRRGYMSWGGVNKLMSWGGVNKLMSWSDSEFCAMPENMLEINLAAGKRKLAPAEQ